MNQFKIFILLNLLFFLMSCGSIKDGFTNQKKNNTDEFLVEKKSPLVMPPDFNELPIPKKQEQDIDKKENDFKELISKKDKEKKAEANNDINKNLEESLLDKFKNN